MQKIATINPGAYQEDDSHVQHECTCSIGNEDRYADSIEFFHCDLRNLHEESHNGVHNGADRGEVVQRHKGIHLVLGAIQQGLNEVDSDSFEDETRQLVQEAGQDKVDLAEGGNDDTEDDKGDIEKLHEVDLFNPESPTSEENCDRHSGLVWSVAVCSCSRTDSAYLEHLDERDAQVQVGHVAAHQTQAEGEANGDNGPQVNAARHLNLLAPIQEGGSARQDLGHNCREGEMPCCQEDGVFCTL